MNGVTLGFIYGAATVLACVGIIYYEWRDHQRKVKEWKQIEL